MRKEMDEQRNSSILDNLESASILNISIIRIFYQLQSLLYICIV